MRNLRLIPGLGCVHGIKHKTTGSMAPHAVARPSGTGAGSVVLDESFVANLNIVRKSIKDKDFDKVIQCHPIPYPVLPVLCYPALISTVHPVCWPHPASRLPAVPCRPWRGSGSPMPSNPHYWMRYSRPQRHRRKLEPSRSNEID